MRLLFIGDSWHGSNARSMREGLSAIDGVSVSEVSGDHYLPNYRGLPLRIANRLLRPWQVRELNAAILRATMSYRPDMVVAYKGLGIEHETILKIKKTGIPTVNIFPDYSPHAYGAQLKRAMGLYDLVISTKPFHPKYWRSIYGYDNPCVFIPHCYDPTIHLWNEPADKWEFDVTLCGTGRPEYQAWLGELADILTDAPVKVAVGGNLWNRTARTWPRSWQFVGPREGRAYGEFLRSGKIVIAPVNRIVVVNGKIQPGDEDTARSYELPAVNCFFLHQRTDYMKTVYDEKTEVPLWGNAAELAALIRRYLPDDAARRSMAEAAHKRAVPAYSYANRSKDILRLIDAHLISSKAATP